MHQSDGALLAWLRDRVMAPVSKRWPVGKIAAASVSGAVGNPLTGMGLYRTASISACAAAGARTFPPWMKNTNVSRGCLGTAGSVT